MIQQAIKKGEIYWVVLPQNNNHIQSGKRPCVIISNEKNNKYAPTVTIVALSTQTQKKLPTHKRVIDNGHKLKKSIAICEQILTIPKTELKDYISTVSNIDEIMEGVRIQLAN